MLRPDDARAGFMEFDVDKRRFSTAVFRAQTFSAMVHYAMAFKRRPEQIGTTLTGLVRKLDPDGHLQVVQLAKVWPEVVGEAIARRTEVSSLKFHTAVIKVSRGMWIQELNLMKRQILERLIARLGDDSVRDLRFVMGSLSRKSSTRPRLVKRETRRALLLPELKDPELRQAFQRLIEAWGRSSR
jgi:predicted nucleic acid-binding Zn ribbon protein